VLESDIFGSTRILYFQHTSLCKKQNIYVRWCEQALTLSNCVYIYPREETLPSVSAEQETVQRSAQTVLRVLAAAEQV